MMKIEKGLKLNIALIIMLIGMIMFCEAVYALRPPLIFTNPKNNPFDEPDGKIAAQDIDSAIATIISSYLKYYEDISTPLIEAEKKFKEQKWQDATALYREALYGVSGAASSGLAGQVATIDVDNDYTRNLRSCIEMVYERVKVCRNNLGLEVAKLPKGVDVDSVMHIDFNPIFLPNGEPVVFSGNPFNMSELRKAFFVFMRQFHENHWGQLSPYLKINDRECERTVRDINRFSPEAYCIKLFRLLLGDQKLRDLMLNALLSSRTNGVFGVRNEKAKELADLGYTEDWMVTADLLFYNFIYFGLVKTLTPEEEALCEKLKAVVADVKGYDGREFYFDLSRILNYQIRDSRICPSRGPCEPLSLRIFQQYNYRPTDPLKIVFDQYRYFTPLSHLLAESRTVSLAHIFHGLNSIFYGSGAKDLRKFFTATTVAYDPQTAYANADEFYAYLRALDANGETEEQVPERFYVEEWGVGNGNYAKDFLDRLKELDKRNNTTYYSRLTYVLVDYSTSMLQDAMVNLQEHKERIITETCDLARSVPMKRQHTLLIRFNELYDDLPGVDIIEKRQDGYYRLELMPVGFMSARPEAIDANATQEGFIQIRTKDGRLLSLSEFVSDYLMVEGTSIEDLDFDSLRPHLGKLHFRQRLVKIDIDSYPYGDFVKSFFKKRETGRVPINITARKNLLAAVGILDVKHRGYVQFFDYGFTTESYEYWLRGGHDGRPLLEITPYSREQSLDIPVYWHEQPTLLINFDWLTREIEANGGVKVTLESQMAYLEGVHNKRFAPIAVLLPKVPINPRINDEDEGVVATLSFLETYVDYLPRCTSFREWPAMDAELKRFSSEWQKADPTNRKELWNQALSALKQNGYIASSLLQAVKDITEYRKDAKIHSIFDLPAIEDAFELSVRMAVNQELNELYKQKEAQKAYWVTDTEIRELKLLNLVFTEEAVRDVIETLWKRIGRENYRFMHVKLEVMRPLSARRSLMGL